ncbi:MAG: glycosyltransferase family 2 protein [Pseudomonadota bacterium]|nr:glycosyltransferase family 2 protein [Pseudomonadota bacterium]
MLRYAPEHEKQSAASQAACDASIDVSAVIPCLNEEKTIGICIQKAFLCFESLGIRGEVVVADNGSTDRSVFVAQRLNARVVCEQRKGYGAALSTGINAASGKVIIMGDADDSYDWSDIAPFVSKVAEGYDLVMGNRFQGGIAPGAMPVLHRYLGNPVLSWMGRQAFHTSIGDFHCGMRAFTKGSFQRMGITSTGMEFATEMVASAAYLGLRIAEVPTKLYPDKRGRPPHLRSFRDGWRHLRFILTYAPNHLYLVPGLGMLLLGILLQLVLIAGPAEIGRLSLGIHFLALGSLLTLVGFNIVAMGILAKALVAQRYERLAGTITQWVQRKFTLEIGLVTGLAMSVLGLGVDLGIALAWLQNPGGPMESTVHLAFVATTTIVLGVNLMFGSFLIHMILLATNRWAYLE